MRIIDADLLLNDLPRKRVMSMCLNIDVCHGYNGCIDSVTKCIKNQPNVNEWIPCSERLPTKEEYCKNDGRFIVSNGIKSYECTFDVYEEIFKQFEYNRKGMWMEYVDDKVIAWQPLPEPYEVPNESR